MMRNKLFLFVLFFCQIILAQNTPEDTRIIEWADYYYINEDHDKALSYFLKIGEELPLASRRNFSKAYARKGELQKAAQSLRPLVDSDSAKVKDYYFFASYLTDNDKLREEYRLKAIRLPIEGESLQTNNSSDTSYKLIPLALNTEDPQFGAHLMDIQNDKVLIYTQKQSKIYTKGLNKKTDSEYTIFNLYQAQWNPETFKAIQSEAFPLGVNSVFQDGPSSWDPKNEILYFTRSALNIPKKETIQLDIYAWSSSSSKKQVALPLPFNSNGFASIHPAVSVKDRRLYFASDRPGGFGGMDLYYVNILDNGVYSQVVNLGPDINTAGHETFPFVYQGKYLFYSDKANNGNLSLKLAVNTVDVRWHVMDLPSPFESDKDDFSFSLDENLDYGFISSNRETGKGDDDLYAFKFTPQMEGMKDLYSYNPIDTLIVSNEGVLKNDEVWMLSNDPLTALFPKEAVLVKNVSHGILKFNANGSFLYKNRAPMQVKDSFTYIVNSKYGKSQAIKVLLERSEVTLEELSETMKKTFLPIFYAFDKSNLLLDYKDRVDAVVSAMKEQPDMIVEVSSFTDCRGSKNYNMKLSHQRNQTIIDYVGKSIDNKDRIFGKGYGENSVKDNSTLDYLLIGGSFAIKDNALKKQKIFNTLGYESEILTTKENIYWVIADQTNTFSEAQRIAKTLFEEEQEVWIKNCECCALSEKEYLQNRRTDFKIIRY